MAVVIVKTQAELNALPAKFEEYTRIEIHGGTRYNRIVVSKARENSSVVARGKTPALRRGKTPALSCSLRLIVLFFPREQL